MFVVRRCCLLASSALMRSTHKLGLPRVMLSSSSGRPLDYEPEHPILSPAQVGDVVEFNFINTLDDGSIIEEARGEDTVRLKLGNENLLKTMESSFVGKVPGDKFSFVVTPEERGEQYDPQNVHEYTVTKEFIELYNISEGERVEIPLSSFEGEDDEDEDEDVPEMTEATVLKVEPLPEGEFGKEEYNITLDFNSEFCDDNYNFHVSFLKNYGDITDPEDEFEEPESKVPPKAKWE
jgi:FKBP-type peptidyl-prolyl cis-trans isomerase 2